MNDGQHLTSNIRKMTVREIRSHMGQGNLKKCLSCGKKRLCYLDSDLEWWCAHCIAAEGVAVCSSCGGLALVDYENCECCGEVL